MVVMLGYSQYVQIHSKNYMYLLQPAYVLISAPNEEDSPVLLHFDYFLNHPMFFVKFLPSDT
jgi:hypothetical protein